MRRIGFLLVACLGCSAMRHDLPTATTQPAEDPPDTPSTVFESPASEPSPPAVVPPSVADTVAAPIAASHAPRISLDLKDADIRNVLRLIAEAGHLNLAATEDVQGKVTLRLFDVPADEALAIVARSLGLETQPEGNFLRVSTSRRLREEREETLKASAARAAAEPMATAYLRLNYAKAEAVAAMLGGGNGPTAEGDDLPLPATSAGTTGGGMLSERGRVLVDPASNTLVVRDIEPGIEQARDLVRVIDVQTPQVSIESRIVELTSDLGRDLGIQWGYRYERSLANGHPRGPSFPNEIGAGGSGLGKGPSELPWIADFPAANVAPGAGSAVGLLLGGADSIHNLELRLTALERDGLARVISRPRVVTLNNVAATIKSLTVIRVKLPAAGPVVQTGSGSSTPRSVATEKIETGIVLMVTPQVSGDGFVLLDLFAKSSQADFTRTVDEIPTEISREANARVLVRDGDTVVLGGIYRESNLEQSSGVPYLRDLPILGSLFRNDGHSRRREDLLVFLTPRILDPQGASRERLPNDAVAAFEIPPTNPPASTATQFGADPDGE